MGYLDQKNRLDPEKTVYQAALDVFSELSREEARLERLSEELKRDYGEDKIRQYTTLQQKFQQKGGYEYRSRARGTLIRMGFDEEKLSLPISALSGGQRIVLKLSLLLLEEPDVLLLDEPTNHLDIRALEWLEDELKKIRSTVLLISHDRLFLDRVTEKTLEIENTRGKLYPVPYSAYREQKKAEREIQDRHFHNQQKEIARIEAFIAQQKRWNRERNIKAAESRQKALDRMVKVEKSEVLPDSLSFRFSEAIESGNDVLSVQHLAKSYGDLVLFRDLDLEVKKKERLLIIGANGSGKTTLLQILAGNLNADGGSYQFGYNVRMGYYDQYQYLSEDKTVLEEVWEGSDSNYTQIRNLLATFLFKGDDVFKEIKVLSGGERARVILAKLMQKKVNLLLLDEPTNHLDIESREALEDALLSFDGTVIAVSHDRYFIRKIATRLLAFRGNGEVFPFQGSFSDYKEFLLKCAPKEKSPKRKEEENDWEKNKRIRQEEQKRLSRLKKIEDMIERSESEIRKIDQMASEISTDYVALQELYEKRNALEKACDQLLEEWTKLEEESKA